MYLGCCVYVYVDLLHFVRVLKRERFRVAVDIRHER